MTPADRAHWRSLLPLVNRASRDDGRRFVQRARLNAIGRALQGSSWEPIARLPLALLFAHRRRRAGAGLLVSSHVDSRYPRHFCREGGDSLLRGTFDNSLTNAALLSLMLADRLPAEALVAFTGDEERDGRGAAQVVGAFRDTAASPGTGIRFALALDVTGAAFGNSCCTIENWHPGRARNTGLPFSTSAELRGWLGEALGHSTPMIHRRSAGPDEAWEYAAHGLACCSLCLPVGPAPENARRGPDAWMHSGLGILARAADVDGYLVAAAQLSRALASALG